MTEAGAEHSRNGAEHPQDRFGESPEPNSEDSLGSASASGLSGGSRAHTQKPGGFETTESLPSTPQPPTRYSLFRALRGDHLTISNDAPLRLRRGPLSRLVLALIIVALVVAGVWAIRERQQVPILLANKDVPAYHVLTDADVELGMGPARDKERYAELSSLGRITLGEVKEGDPIFDTNLLPDMTSVMGKMPVVVGFDVSRGTVLGGALPAGTRIRLILTRPNNQVVRLRAVVLAAESGEAGANEWSLVVALRAPDAQRYATAFATSRLTVLRDALQEIGS